MGYEEAFGSIDVDGMMTENDRLNAEPGIGNGLAKYIAMPEGDGYIEVRILPPLKGKKLFQATRLHYMNGRKIHCAKELVNGKWVGECPICAYYNSLWRQIDKLEKAGEVVRAEALKGEARSIKPVERYYYNGIVRKEYDKETQETKTNVGPKILSVGQKLHKRIVTAIVGDESAGEKALGNITDVKNGRDFKIVKKMVRSGNDQFPNYDQSKMLDTSAAGSPEEIQRWIENMHDLTEERRVKEMDELEKQLAIHRGLIKDDSTGFDTEKFDAKWGNGDKASVVTDEVHNTSEAKTSEESLSTPLDEGDIPIDEEEFSAELDDLKAQIGEG